MKPTKLKNTHPIDVKMAKDGVTLTTDMGIQCGRAGEFLYEKWKFENHYTSGRDSHEDWEWWIFLDLTGVASYKGLFIPVPFKISPEKPLESDIPKEIMVAYLNSLKETIDKMPVVFYQNEEDTNPYRSFKKERAKIFYNYTTGHIDECNFPHSLPWWMKSPVPESFLEQRENFESNLKRITEILGIKYHIEINIKWRYINSSMEISKPNIDMFFYKKQYKNDAISSIILDCAKYFLTEDSKHFSLYNQIQQTISFNSKGVCLDANSSFFIFGKEDCSISNHEKLVLIKKLKEEFPGIPLN